MLLVNGQQVEVEGDICTVLTRASAPEYSHRALVHIAGSIQPCPKDPGTYRLVRYGIPSKAYLESVS